jgi:hypothetical protein
MKPDDVDEPESFQRADRSPPRWRSSTPGWWTAAAVVALVAAIANVVVFAVAASNLDGDVLIPTSPGSDDTTALNVVVVAASTAMAAALAAVLAWWLSRFSAGIRWFMVLTVTGAAVSMVGPLSASIPTSSTITLVAMHVVASAIIIGGLGRVMGHTMNR